MQPLPNQNAPFVRLPSGIIIPPWNSYLQQFTQAPPNFIDVISTGSPFSYTAKEPGFISITSGTISLINLFRGSKSIDVTGVSLIPVSINDIITITYSVLPTIKFVPIYGAAAR